ncbi:MAG TPA: hypothetical protein VI776_04885 [Anaerolineales bacterium]|nr:hypothetical protein [Anaerolineales bacterium]
MKHMHRSFRARFFPSSGYPVPLLTAGEITQLSWSKLLPTIEDAPEMYRASLETLAWRAQTHPTMIFIPTFGNFRRSDQGKILCSLDERIYLLESEKNTVTTTCYPIEDINYFDLGMVLLQGWIKLRGMTEEGQSAFFTVVFNRVNLILFHPILLQIRRASGEPGGRASEAELQKFDHLIDRNYKLMNYARASLLPEDCVMYSVLQPDIRRRMLSLFGKSYYQTLAHAHLFILTDRELILIRDENLVKWRADLRYGGIWSYFPREKVTSLSLSKSAEESLVLSIHLPHDDRIDLLYSPERGDELDQLLGLFESSRSAAPRPAGIWN